MCVASICIAKSCILFLCLLHQIFQTINLGNILTVYECTQGKEVTENPGKGALCIKSVWPGMARTIYGDHERFLNTYYNPYPGGFRI